MDLLLVINPASDLSLSPDLCAVAQPMSLSRVSGFRLGDLGSTLGMATKYISFRNDVSTESDAKQALYSAVFIGSAFEANAVGR